MAVRVTHRRMSPGGARNEHITNVKWLNESTGKIGVNTKAQMVDYIDNQKGSAYVTGPQSRSEVGTVHRAGTVPYLRTFANGVPNDNLLSLPTY